jgi:uncharacterized membrane protein YccC
MKPYLKALGAAVVAGAGAAGVAQADGISAGEWWTIAGAFLAGGIATFYIPYQTTKPPA